VPVGRKFLGGGGALVDIGAPLNRRGLSFKSSWGHQVARYGEGIDHRTGKKMWREMVTLLPAGLEQDLLYTLRGIDCHAVLFRICYPRRGLQVLEAGCGSGKLGLKYWINGADVVLMDIDPGVLAYTRALTDLVRREVLESLERPPGRLEILEGSIMSLPFEAEEFDIVFNEGVPAHWPEDAKRQAAINEMVRVTTRGGAVCVIGSNAHCPGMMAYADTVDHTYADMPPKQRPWTREELEAKLRAAGLEEITITPVGGPWEKAMLLAGWGRKP